MTDTINFLKGINKFLLIFTCLFFANKVYADNFVRYKQALPIMQDFAESICTTIPLEGKNSQFELTAESKIELNGLIKKLADLGLEGAVKYKNQKYNNLLQKDIASLLSQNINCRLEVYKKLIDILKDQILENKETQPTNIDINNNQSTVINPKINIENKPNIIINNDRSDNNNDKKYLKYFLLSFLLWLTSL